jgi:RNA polymerase sigma-70 factor (ECF subfamily)
MPADEAELVARLRQGDEGALASLFSLYRERLWRLVTFRIPPRLNGRLDAEDVLQEAYLAAAARLQHFRAGSSGSFFVWLRLVVVQTLTDLQRQHLGAQMRDAGREVSLQGGWGQGTSAALAAQLLGSLTSPSQAAIRDELAGRLGDALEGMNPVDREILALRHFEELTNQETAEVLGIEQKAASIRYVRALKRLREILSGMSEFQGQSHEDQ